MSNNNNISYSDNFLLKLKFNVNDLRNQAHELKTVLNNKRIDIIFIYESHITCNEYLRQVKY
jgi:exonuclease III